MRRPLTDNRGFSLVWIAVLIAVAGVMLAAVLPGGQAGSDEEKRALTLRRMEKIEEATRAFMAANLRRPCPSGGTYLQSSANFGVEANLPGKCSGTIRANFVGGTTVPTAAAGGVPVRTLGLSDDYAVDGYGHRFMYVVDRDATAPQTCHDLESHSASGRLRILSSSGGSSALDSTMWALVSYGKAGQGAYPLQGGSIRIDVGNTNADAAIDAFGTAGHINTSPVFTGTLVQHDPSGSGTTGFDTIVWFLNSSKNLCALGEAANNGFRIAGTNTTTNATNGITVAAGDINGDGITDLVIGMNSANGGAGLVYVLFGSALGWPQGGLPTPSPILLSAITGNGYSISSLGQTNPASIGSLLNPGAGKPVYLTNVGNFPQLSNRCYLAGTSGASSFTLTDMNGTNIDTTNTGFYTGNGEAMNGCGAVITNDLSGGSLVSFGWSLGVGDINGDGYADIVAGGISFDGTSQFSVILGNSSFPSMPLSQIYLSNTPTKGMRLKNGITSISRDIVFGDFNGDGIKDVLMVDGPSHAYVLYGQSSLATWSGSGFYSQPLLDLTSASFTKTYGFIITDSSGTYPFPTGVMGGVAAGDLNGAVNGSNNIDEIALSSDFYSSGTGSVYVLFPYNFTNADFVGACASPPCKFDISTKMVTPNKVVQFTTSRAAEHLGSSLVIADINGDGIADLLMSSFSYVYGYYGGAGAWGSASIPINLNASFTIDTMTNRPSMLSGVPFPHYMAVGDLNGDGIPDLVLATNSTLGAASGYTTGRLNAGSVFVIDQPSTFFTGSYVMFGTALFGNSQWFNSTSGNPNSGDASHGFRVDGLDGDQLETALVFDLNHDGKNDLIIPAPGNGSWMNAPGAVYVLYGRRTVPYDPVFDVTHIQ